MTDTSPLACAGEFPVLVTASATLGAIAVIRSLGRAGYPVHAVDSDADALGFRSRFARCVAVHPEFDSSEFLPWLDRYINYHGIRLIIASEGFLRAMVTRFADYAPLLPMPADLASVARAFSKFELFEALLAANEAHLPPTVLIEGDRLGSAAIANLGAPVFLKTDADTTRGLSALVENIPNGDAAIQRAAVLASRYGRLLAQGNVAGQGVGAFICRWRGRELASFVHRRLHEVPYTGGVSSLRESWRHEGILTHARGVLDRLGWEGVAMLEYRWDPSTGQFWLLELNARFWGSLHLALFANVDFPRILADAFRGEVAPAGSYPVDLRCRSTFPGEVQHLWSKLKEPRLSLGGKLIAVLEFFWLSLDPRVKEDLLFPGDRMLYFHNLLLQARVWGKVLRNR
jgi:predicted ATP-grasp superfamily ATP-dependent carboligase